MLLLVACAACPFVASAQPVPNQKLVLSHARGAYYSLRQEGLDAFACDVTPNWQLVLEKESRQNPQGVHNAIETLNQLHFTVSLASDNSVKLTHNELTGQSSKMMAALGKIYGGMEQMATGFFDTWKMFLLNSPLPEVDSTYRLEAEGRRYVLSYKDDLTDVVTTMGRDFAISDLKVTTAQFDSAIQPTFLRTPKGLVLSAYQASYKSQNAEETTQLKVAIDYQTVDGLQMLRRLNLSGTYGDSPFAVELTFSNCRVTKKP
jgi:hypothetical protein